jgi:FlaA1/EpsC-like NDP-sugar epimerase
MARYFMTIPEAAQLVIEAGGIGESGVTYVLDMGEPVKIRDLAQDLIRLSGLKPGEDIEIVCTGIRPGEKMYEEIVADSEVVIASPHKKIFAVQCGPLPADLEPLIGELYTAAAAYDAPHIREILHRLIPTYQLPAAPLPAEVQARKLFLNLPIVGIHEPGRDGVHESAAPAG